jgi:hypothetical protein
LGGDLNFIAGKGEILGNAIKNDPLVDFFILELKEVELVDVEPYRLVLTWRN